jgi:sialic acid synthase SpsE
VKRPGGHLPPTAYWEVLGRSAGRAYRADEPLDAPDADGGAPA